MTSPMYPYFYNMRKMGRLTDIQIDNALNKGYITEEEAYILYAIPDRSL